VGRAGAPCSAPTPHQQPQHDERRAAVVQAAPRGLQCRPVHCAAQQSKLASELEGPRCAGPDRSPCTAPRAPRRVLVSAEQATRAAAATWVQCCYSAGTVMDRCALRSHDSSDERPQCGQFAHWRGRGPAAAERAVAMRKPRKRAHVRRIMCGLRTRLAKQRVLNQRCWLPHAIGSHKVHARDNAGLQLNVP
jgi:hypothetical protein